MAPVMTQGKAKATTSTKKTKQNFGPMIVTSLKWNPRAPVVKLCECKQPNIIQTLYQYKTGCCLINKMKQALVNPFNQKLTTFRILRNGSPFDRRVTAMAWHPTKPTTLCAAAKNGDLILWDYEKDDSSKFIRGIGKGGAVATIIFDLDQPSHIYTASLDGMVVRQDFEDRGRHVMLNTNDWNLWFCSLDVNFKSNLLLAGDNKGKVTLMTRSAEKVWCHRLHKKKVTHCEFNPKCDWLFATASTDKTVKLWDVRMIRDRHSFIDNLPHEKPINSACFSADGARLLTTDQHSEVRIYTGPYWSKIHRTIRHPHRFFQHITPIKASWHPHYELIVIGRYPDPNFPGYRTGECYRTIDMFDANSGEVVCQLLDPSAAGIVSLNKFSLVGNALASAMGYHILIWTDDEAFQRRLVLRGVATREVFSHRWTIES